PIARWAEPREVLVGKCPRLAPRCQGCEQRLIGLGRWVPLRRLDGEQQRKRWVAIERCGGFRGEPKSVPSRQRLLLGLARHLRGPELFLVRVAPQRGAGEGSVVAERQCRLSMTQCVLEPSFAFSNLCLLQL